MKSSKKMNSTMKTTMNLRSRHRAGPTLATLACVTGSKRRPVPTAKRLLRDPLQIQQERIVERRLPVLLEPPGRAAVAGFHVGF